MEDRAPSCQLRPARDSRFYQPEGTPNKELKSLKSPSSAQEIFALFEASNRAVIWIRDEDCFIHDWNTERPSDYLYEFKWTVVMQGKAADLYICSKSVSGATNCLGYLFDLKMETTPGSSSNLTITCLGPPAIDVFQLFPLVEEMICPFPCHILEKYILQNQKGSCGFQGMTFTRSQCTVLATSGTQTHLVFDKCRFEDGGMAFVEALLSVDNVQSGPVKVEFKFFIALDDTNLIACLSKLKALRLEAPTNFSEEMGSAIVSADLEYLALSRMKLHRAETILISNIRKGRGPRGINLGPSVFSSIKQFLNFCNALNGQGHLQSLELSDISGLREPNLEVENALLAAWGGEYFRLTTFGLSNSCITESFWKSLLHQIRLKACIVTLNFANVEIKDSTTTPEARKACMVTPDFANVEIQDSTTTPEARTRDLSKVILANERMVQMKMCSSLFDKTAWKQFVVPSLEVNEHRDHFANLAMVGDMHTRKALLAGALNKLNDRLSLIYVLLHQNLDVAADSVVERNENRKPSANGRVNNFPISTFNEVISLQNLDDPVVDSWSPEQFGCSTEQRKKPRVQ